MKIKSKINFYLSILIPEFIIKNIIINTFYRLFYFYFLNKIKKRANVVNGHNLYSKIKDIIPQSDSINDISVKEKNNLIKNGNHILRYISVKNIDFEILIGIGLFKFISMETWHILGNYAQVDLSSNSDVKILGIKSISSYSSSCSCL